MYDSNAASLSYRCKNSPAKYVAKPSLNHKSDHVDSVTESPNHWCAISCAITSVVPSGMPNVLLIRGDARDVNSVLVNTIALEFSIPPKRVAPTISASFSYGYGATVSLKNAIDCIDGAKPFIASGASTCGT